ncbi:MAG: SLBB domain-containing protein [Actinobacteria bacterium]|nr:SLBB domain-containing protein [Actinomycetota bacterium]
MGRLGIETRSSLSMHLSEYGPLPATPRRHGSEPGSLVDEVETAGLRGRGGGWFPTSRKLRAVVESSAGRGRLNRSRHPVVIANGMEGEPASSKDAGLLASSAHLVFDGISAAAATVGATNAFLAIHRDSPVIPTLLKALDERHAARLDPLAIHLVTPPARYVASEESALSHWVGEGVATPVYPDRPFQKGAAGRPTLVQNVETLAHLGLIARHGGAWFAELGAPSAPGSTLVTVGGAVRDAGVVEVPTGTPVRQILELCGGATEPVRGYLTGGYGGGWVAADGFDTTAWDPESMRTAGAVIGASVLWLIGESTCPIDEMARVAAWMAGESAGQCGPCVYGLPSLSDDVHQLATRHADAADMARLERRLSLVSNRGGCKHPDGTARFVSTGLAAFADEVALHLDRRCSVTARGQGPAAMPVPPARLALVDVSGRDFE